jgi:hypothetical protein
VQRCRWLTLFVPLYAGRGTIRGAHYAVVTLVGFSLNLLLFWYLFRSRSAG